MAANGSDSAPEAGAPDDEIEITPDTIEAGLVPLFLFTRKVAMSEGWWLISTASCFRLVGALKGVREQ
jgi:hypothetical protein